MNRKKGLLYSSGVVLLIVTVGLVWFRGNGSDKITYRLEKVDRGDIVVSVTATGTLNPDTTVQVGSQVSGIIAKIFVDYNSSVKRGQILAQLDPTFYKAAADQARANVGKARAQLNDAQRTYNRQKELFAKNLIAQADMDAATTALESTQAGFEQAVAALNQAEVSLKNTTITAPISGVVISRNVDVGQTVAASFQAPTLFSIANDLRKMQVEASVDEADIGNVISGEEVTFRVDTYPDKQFEGKVTQIRLAPVVNQNVVTYTVIISVANPEQKLMPGMTAQVSIQVASRESVLRLPLQAIQYTPQGVVSEETGGGRRTNGRAMSAPGSSPNVSNHLQGHATVWMLEQGKPKRVVFARGIQDLRYVEVLDSSLKEGDQVIVEETGGQRGAQVAGQNPFAPQMPGGRGRRGGL